MRKNNGTRHRMKLLVRNRLCGILSMIDTVSLVSMSTSVDWYLHPGVHRRWISCPTCHVSCHHRISCPTCPVSCLRHCHDNNNDATYDWLTFLSTYHSPRPQLQPCILTSQQLNSPPICYQWLDQQLWYNVLYIDDIWTNEITAQFAWNSSGDAKIDDATGTQNYK